MPIRRLSNLLLRYEYSTTPSLHKTKVRCIKKQQFKLVDWIFQTFCRVTIYNFVQINIITPNYAYHEIIKLKFSYEYSMMLIWHKT
jgi:hypothetical protein